MFWSGLAMIFFVGFSEFPVGEMGVDLGGGDGRVAEEFLDGADVGAAVKEFGGVGVAEGVRRDFFGEAGKEGVFSDNFLDGVVGEAAFFAGG